MIVGGVVSATVRVAVQVAWLPAASVTVMVMRVLPNAAGEPARGDCDFTRAAAGVQLSDATNCASRSGTSAWHWSLADTVKLAGQTTVGGVVSTTVKVVVQVAGLPAASVTVMVIGIVPQVTNVPATGTCAFSKEAAGVQLSAALSVARKSGTSAWPLLSAETVNPAGQTMVGGVVSATVRVVVQVARLPELSVTVMVMGLFPSAAREPAGGDWDFTKDAAAVQMSDAANCASKSGTTAWHWSLAASVKFAGQTMVGGVVSTTLTLTVAWAETPYGSVTRRVILCAPKARPTLMMAVVPSRTLPSLH